MRRSLVVLATMAAAMLAPVVSPAAANSAVRASAVSDAVVSAVSCAPGGECAAGGHYVDASSHAEAFVLTEVNGTWGTAIEVPGLASLRSVNAGISAVSCAPGGCVAGGYYQVAGSHYRAFVTSETDGRWGRLVTIFSPGQKATAVTQVRSLSCSGPRNCTAGGGKPAFVVSEAGGRWGRAFQFRGAQTHNRVMVSCASAGNCSAGWGTLVASERNGHWGKPLTVPGLAALGSGAVITALSCQAAASCAVGGTYASRHGIEVFVASKRSGRWAKAIEIPGFTALNKERAGLLASLSCVSAGNCVAGGSYAQPADFAGGVYEPFVASEQNGRWGKAIEVPGIPPAGSTVCEPDSSSCVAGQVFSVSCASGGTCAVGGWYDTTAISGNVAFVASYKNGRWTKATEVPGLKALDTAKFSAVNSVSCTPAGLCAAGGSYSNSAQQSQPAFVVGYRSGAWGQAQTVGFQG